MELETWPMRTESQVLEQISCTKPLRFNSPTQKIETEDTLMTRIKLRDYYPFYSVDLFVDIPDEVEATLTEAEPITARHLPTS